MIITCIAISLVTYLLIKEYTFNTKQTLRKYTSIILPILIPLWTILLLIFFLFISPGIGNKMENKMFFIALVSFSSFNMISLLFLKILYDKHRLFWVLFVPVTCFFILNLLLFNRPTYNGAMDGFGNIITLYFMSMILISYPLFLFSFSMLKSTNLLKGIVMIIIAAISGFIGVRQSIGIEGYLADRSGVIFAFIILILIVVGIHYILKEYKIQIIDSIKEKVYRQN